MIGGSLMNDFVSKETIKNAVVDSLRNLFRKTVDTATDVEIYEAAVYALRTVFTEKWIKTHDEYREKDVKVVYYLSMEFLMGRFFGNSVMNLMMYDTVREALEELGFDYNSIENTEPDPGLGTAVWADSRPASLIPFQPWNTPPMAVE